MKAPDKIYLCADAPRVYDWSNAPFEKGGNIEYIRKGTIYNVINKRLQELWCASSSQADNDEYYKNPLVKELKGLINEIESL